MINKTLIKYVESANNLGITFNRTLNWNDHVNKAVGKTYGLIRSLSLVKSSLPVSVRLLIAKSYSISRFIFKMHRSDHVTQLDFMKSTIIIYLHKVIYTRKPLFEKLQLSRSTKTKNIICIRYRFMLSKRQFL